MKPTVAIMNMAAIREALCAFVNSRMVCVTAFVLRG